MEIYATPARENRTGTRKVSQRIAVRLVLTHSDDNTEIISTPSFETTMR